LSIIKDKETEILLTTILPRISTPFAVIILITSRIFADTISRRGGHSHMRGGKIQREGI